MHKRREPSGEALTAEEAAAQINLAAAQTPLQIVYAPAPSVNG